MCQDSAGGGKDTPPLIGFARVEESQLSAFQPPVIITEMEVFATEQVRAGYYALEICSMIHWSSDVNNSVLILGLQLWFHPSLCFM